RDGTAESPEHVKVRGFRRQRHSQRGVGSLSVEAGAAQASSGEEVRDRFHAFFRNNSAGGAPVPRRLAPARWLDEFGVQRDLRVALEKLRDGAAVLGVVG